ncbi:MAG: hypothetical protein Athens101428_822 [Candidatus Berkelbacteria bacterium Athens1014_28]|uniref:PEBP family protein n=1 Tax=Candidatus Berkelbacteria bacterium Athens1014_28 TaxID=2017145 RepID=A0A554LIZ2_9BACT|nr:MAG: hypothetical protein Athens101428_822 [Candidatus Berkelbacteria bacterium Athens1014_28]
MKLVSSDFQNNGELPAKFTCDGEGIWPNLQWSEFPAETKSFTFYLYDPDAPSGNFIHWFLINIPKEIVEIKSDEKPTCDELSNSSGKVGWYPPCPPSGKHRYVFEIFALSVEKLNISEIKNKTDLSSYILDSAQIIGLYQRK